MVLLGQTKLDTIEVLISKALMDSYINYDEFVSVNNVLREYYIKTMKMYCASSKKNTANKN